MFEQSGLSGLSELETPRGGSVRIQHRPPKHGTVSSLPGGSSGSPSSNAASSSRFPKLDECAHFHYDVVDLGPLTVLRAASIGPRRDELNHAPHAPFYLGRASWRTSNVFFFSSALQIQLYEESGKFAAAETEGALVALQITSYGKSWVVRRSYEHFRLLDEQLHRCIYDRKFSQLPLLPDQRPDDQQQQPPEVSVVGFLDATVRSVVSRTRALSLAPIFSADGGDRRPLARCRNSRRPAIRQPRRPRHGREIGGPGRADGRAVPSARSARLGERAAKLSVGGPFVPRSSSTRVPDGGRGASPAPRRAGRRPGSEAYVLVARVLLGGREERQGSGRRRRESSRVGADSGRGE